MKFTMASPEESSQYHASRERAIEAEFRQGMMRRTDGQFAILAGVEWLLGICAAIWITPSAYAGYRSMVHPNIWIAVCFGGVIASLPCILAALHPGRVVTRHAMAAAQMLMAGLIVHLTGGRTETHFMYFGLMAFLSFYQDWRVLATATLVAGTDHLLRAAMWPESMYGLSTVPIWLPVEHAGWLFLEAVVLAYFLGEGRRGMMTTAERQAKLESIGEHIALEVSARTVELADSENRYRAIFENSPLPMWLCDVETLMFMAVNKKAVEMYGYSNEEFQRMRTIEIRPAEELEGFQRYLGERDDKTNPMKEWRHRKKDGTVIDVEVTSHLVEWCGRKAVLVLSNDISDRKRAEREKVAMEIQLRHAQKLESIGQLAAGIAHEINTPTQYIGDNLHFLRDAFREMQSVLKTQVRLLPEMEGQGATNGPASEIRAALEAADAPYLMDEVPKALEQAMEGVSRVSTLVRAMKEFSHPGQKEKSQVNLNSAIQSTITVARNEWKYVAEMEVDLAPDLPLVPCLMSDMNQVVLNLIVNAAHAIGAPSGAGKLGLIRISTRANADTVEIRVGDSGSGIPVEIRERIFDPFFTTKAVGKGTGQGLAIAHAVVVDMHGGTIHFETEIDKGTEFVIRLPLDGVALSGGKSEALVEAPTAWTRF